MHVLKIVACVLACAVAAPCRAQDRVTILYDAFGESKELTKDWGFSALVEHNGKRILFDTGNNATIFEHNVKALGVDLTKLDFVVISHRHADHATGLRYVLSVNPNVTVYVPSDGSNGFGGAPFSKSYLRADDSLPASMRYFGGAEPDHFTSGKLYDTGNFVLVNQTTEVSPGIFLVRTVSQKQGTLELPELTLAIKRPNGLLLVDGCSHAGIEAILQAASAVDPRTEIVFGGLHLVTTPVEEIDVLVENLKTKWKVERIAPGHCTGEPAFARLKKAYGENYLYAGLGTKVELQ
ncbi:MAG: MBL fold metallo-hydrolase [Candidatus Acidiferrales bacterium]|jgi:7,8-dihydropterin-6-yl-methyl-4-(beta-D-ribofuranosyl)aminobenzene 5'-phosphate synthase